jgi:hypothetical protein
MTARDLPLFPALRRRFAGRRLLAAGALLAATVVHATPVPAVTGAPLQSPQQTAFAFGRGLVAPPRMSSMAAVSAQAAAATDAAPAHDTTPRARPYRSACNFTTGCH